MPARRFAAAVALAAAGSVLCAACSTGSASGGPNDPIVAVGAEDEYANVISQIGGRYVQVSAVESNPNTDPHTFESSARVSEVVSSAQLVVQNGLDYDQYMNRIESAAPNSSRKIIDVQKLLGLPDGTPNPHLWYAPSTMPAVASAIAGDLTALRPAHAAYFRARLATFDASLRAWIAAIVTFRKAYAGTPAATTEPVGDYLLQALGMRNLTPFGLQADVMNGVDLSPQYVTLEDNLLRQHKVKVFVYNQQVVDSVTQSFLAAAHQGGVPVVGVYETMPAGFTYQRWMLAEVRALREAVSSGTSTVKL